MTTRSEIEVEDICSLGFQDISMALKRMVLEVKVHVVICGSNSKHQKHMFKGDWYMYSKFVNHVCSNDQVKSKVLENLHEHSMSTRISILMM